MSEAEDERAASSPGDDVTDVPWRAVPVSEPLLPGEASAAERERVGWTVLMPALISVIANVTTSAARRLIEEGAVTLDGRPALTGFDKVKPGMSVTVRDRKFRIGQPESAPRWR